MREVTFHFNIVVVIDRKNEDRIIIQEGYLFYFSTSFVYMYIVLKSSLRNATFCKLSCMSYVQVVLLYFFCYTGSGLGSFNIFNSEPLFFWSFI